MLDDPRTDPSPVRLSLEPLDDYVVIEPTDEEAETRAGLILPASAAADCSFGIVIAVGSDADGLSPGEVARRLGLATPTVTRAATRMEASGLLRREPHPTDRRLVRLVLTAKGRALEDAIGREMRQLNDRALAGLTRTQLTTLMHALEAIQKNLADRG